MKISPLLLLALFLGAIMLNFGLAFLAGWLVAHFGAPTWVGVLVGIAVFVFAPARAKVSA